MNRWIALASLSLCSVGALAQIMETEDNNAYATANLATIATLGSAGTRFEGVTTGTATTAGLSSVDYWRLATPTAPLGIYRYRSFIEKKVASDGNHTGTLRAVTAPGATTDSTSVQSSLLIGAAVTNTWYSFGRANESQVIRVAGSSTTTGGYSGYVERDQVTLDNPSNALRLRRLGQYQAGSITIETTPTLDTELFVFDSNLNPIQNWNNDDPASGITKAKLTRNFAAGTYYVCFGIFNSHWPLGRNLIDDNSTNSTATDGGTIWVNNNTTSTIDLSFRLTDSLGARDFLANDAQTSGLRNDGGMMIWGQMQVVPEPASMLALLAGAGCLAVRRRRAR